MKRGHWEHRSCADEYGDVWLIISRQEIQGRSKLRFYQKGHIILRQYSKKKKEEKHNRTKHEEIQVIKGKIFSQILPQYK